MKTITTDPRFQMLTRAGAEDDLQVRHRSAETADTKQDGLRF